MGCGSSQEVAPHPNTVPNGNVKREATPPVQPAPQEPQRRAESPKEKLVETKQEVTNNEGQSAELQEPVATKSKPDTNENQDQPDFNEDILKSFVELETQIKELESKDWETIYRAPYNRLLELHKNMTAQGGKVEDLKKQTAKEYQDIVQITNPSVRTMFASQGQHDAQLVQEQQEYVDALNRQEVAEQELESLKEQYKNSYNTYNNEMENVKKEWDLLNQCRSKQEELLGKIFNDSYGSDKEWKLEMDLDMLSEKKDRIHGAHYKWTNARKFVFTACNQIGWAARRWAQMSTNNVQAPMVRYQMSAETRNHLVAAAQNIKGAHGFLQPIKVPYCNEEDLNQLNEAISTIFHDVQVPNLYSRAYALYVDQYNKSLNLLNWIDHVLKNTINKDFTEVKKLYHDKYYELKEERMKLIQANIKEKLGIEMTFELKKEEFKEEAESGTETEADVVKPGEVQKEEGEELAPEPEEQTGEPPAPTAVAASPEASSPEATATEGEAEATSAPNVIAVPLSELAPPPNQEDLFGDIAQLKQKHEEEMAEFEKAQELNKTRVEQGLQEKLRARRSRKRKIQNQQAEAEVLVPPPE